MPFGGSIETVPRTSSCAMKRKTSDVFPPTVSGTRLRVSASVNVIAIVGFAPTNPNSAAWRGGGKRRMG